MAGRADTKADRALSADIAGFGERGLEALIPPGAVFVQALLTTLRGGAFTIKFIKRIAGTATDKQKGDGEGGNVFHRILR
ncbi:MAG TPA: hypothetical protein VGC31_03750 [Paenirhodobacter sp.]